MNIRSLLQQTMCLTKRRPVNFDLELLISNIRMVLILTMGKILDPKEYFTNSVQNKTSFCVTKIPTLT